MEINITETIDKYNTAKEDNKLNVSRAKAGLSNNPIREAIKQTVEAFKNAEKDEVVFDFTEMAKQLNHSSDISHMRDKYLRAVESVIVETRSEEDFKKMNGLYHPNNTEILRKYCPNRNFMKIDFNAQEDLLFVTIPLTEFEND